MKLSKYLENLQKLQERNNGIDVEVSFSVKDHFSKYGQPASFAGDSPNAKFYDGTFTNTLQGDGHMTIFLNLKPDTDGKNPKITFRK